ncbi:hypothetical protein BDR04DRAFT_1010186, partial [Suillus decipiens]
ALQNQLPRGTTILGTILSSDRTNTTTMTGARVAYPLLLGLVNIHMCTCTKLLPSAFLLTALLPIPHICTQINRCRVCLKIASYTSVLSLSQPF